MFTRTLKSTLFPYTTLFRSIDDAIATYRRILQLDPNNITYRMRLINLLSAQAHAVSKDRKSTRLNSSHVSISYAVFCLQKKKICRGIIRLSYTWIPDIVLCL